MSEIQEEPDEDYEENLTKILDKALDYANPVQTEGALEVEEIEDSDELRSLFSQRRDHALTEIQPAVIACIKPSLHTLRVSNAIRKIGRNARNL